MRILTIILAALAWAVPAHVAALDTEPMPLRGRHLPAMALASNVRPYVIGAIGPYAGSAGSMRTGVVTTEIGAHSDTVPAGRIGLGLDMLFRSWIALGIEAGYAVTGDFGRPIGGESNYSSADFMISLGVSLGGIR